MMEREARQRKKLEGERRSVWDMMKSFTTSGNNETLSALKQDCTALEELSRQLFLESVDLHNEQTRREELKTLKGRYFNILGYFFSIYCCWKIFMATINIVFDRVGKVDPITRGIEIAVKWLGIQFDNTWLPYREPRVVEIVAPGSRAAVTAQPVNERYLVTIASETGYKSVINFRPVGFWSQHISFWLIGIMIITSIRGLLITLTKFFYAIASSKSSNVIVLCLAQIMGMYFISSVLLMRMNMPLEYRMIITQVLGDLQFNFYHRWFDVIFLVSALSSIGFLYIAHKQAPEKSVI